MRLELEFIDLAVNLRGVAKLYSDECFWCVLSRVLSKSVSDGETSFYKDTSHTGLKVHPSPGRPHLN